jgi:hypothetical protein
MSQAVDNIMDFISCFNGGHGLQRIETFSQSEWENPELVVLSSEASRWRCSWNVRGVSNGTNEPSELDFGLLIGSWIVMGVRTRLWIWD